MRLLATLAAVCLSTSLYSAPLADPPVGKAAPKLKAASVDGASWDLAKLKGKTVVLEWINRGCPFVEKHYGAGNMQSLQKKYTDQGVVWLGVVSSSEGKEGYFADDAEAKAWMAEQKSSLSGLIRDTEGAIGK